MRYPVVLHKDPDSDYGVTVPDLPGCFSAGVTPDDALTQAREAIECHLEGLLSSGEALPQPGSIEDHRQAPSTMTAPQGFLTQSLSFDCLAHP